MSATAVDVAIVDSGGANIASLEFALARLGAQGIVTRDAGVIRAAKRVLLPGVGSAADAMSRLAGAGLIPVLRGLEQPVLGICLGMQLLFEQSAEGDCECLGILPGRIERLAVAPLPVPHMGWNQLQPQRADPLLTDIPAGAHFYFVHSFAAAAAAHTLATADYGGPLSAVVRRGNFRGVQFHPERSARHGAQLLRNFLAVEA